LKLGLRSPRWVLLAKLVLRENNSSKQEKEHLLSKEQFEKLDYNFCTLICGRLYRRSTYVKPVDLFIPARNAEKRTASNA